MAKSLPPSRAGQKREFWTALGASVPGGLFCSWKLRERPTNRTMTMNTLHFSREFSFEAGILGLRSVTGLVRILHGTGPSVFALPFDDAVGHSPFAHIVGAHLETPVSRPLGHGGTFDGFLLVYQPLHVTGYGHCFSSGAIWISRQDTSCKGSGKRETRSRLNRSLDHPLVYRP